MKVSEILNAMGERVEHGNISYIFAGSKIRFEPHKGFVYSGILRDIRASCIVNASIEHVDRKEECMDKKDIKNNLNGTVYYNGKPYVLKAGEVVYRCELYDPKANLVFSVDADLVNVEQGVVK